MCDFRRITKIKVDEKIIDTSIPKIIQPTDMNKVKDPGLYYICASGSHHLYFDGEAWCGEKTRFVTSSKTFEVVDYKEIEYKGVSFMSSSAPTIISKVMAVHDSSCYGYNRG